MNIYAVIVCIISLSYVQANPGGSVVQDSAEARHLFGLADKNQDLRLDPAEFHTIFLDFDINNDTKITGDEFIQDWLSRGLGTALEAHTLFHHLDVDRSGFISEDPDLPFIIFFFDRDSDGHISESEFVIQWQKIQNS